MKWPGKFWWIGLVTIIALGAILVVYNPAPVAASFDFDDGTVQGWSFDGVYDDAGKKTNGALFPQSMLTNVNNELVFFPDQLGLGLKQAGFSATSEYWRVDLVSPALGPAWKGLTGIEFDVRDQVGLVDNGLEVLPFIRYAAGGQTVEVPAQAPFTPTLQHDSWTTVSEVIPLPAGATPLAIVLRIRGRWATPGSPVIAAYEGQVYVDDVTKIN
ncbi:MAG: hypothetical protein V2I65_02175 [Paracoccaceae bacterium]|jgi:hypothetical protein|nr:hypothetical protein [Paracoccaceae bacterium]